MMRTTSLSDFRANLESLLDSTTQNHEPLLVTRQQGDSLVVMSLADYNAHRATVSLLANPESGMKLMKSIEEHRRGDLLNVNIDELTQFIEKE